MIQNQGIIFNITSLYYNYLNCYFCTIYITGLCVMYSDDMTMIDGD